MVVPDYGKVSCDDKAISSILSLTTLVNQYIVIYDSHKYDAFAVYTNRGINKFSMNKQGLYVFKPTYTT